MINSILLNKEKLDLMTSSEICEFRQNLIIKTEDFSLIKTYLDELDVYDIIRFKAEKFEMFDRWCKKARSNENNDSLLTFNVEMLERPNGYENMYYLGLISDLNKIKEFKYIIGIEINIPDEYKKIFNFNQ